MKYIGIMGLIVAAVLVCSVPSASAFCARVDEAGTGNRDDSCRTNMGGTANEYINILLVFEPAIARGLFCAIVSERATGNKLTRDCNGRAVRGSEFILVRDIPIPVFAEAEEGKTGLTATGGESVLSGNNGTDRVICEKSSFAGEISELALIGDIVEHFLGCKSSGATKSGCSANSTGSSAGLIITRTLHGILGLALPSNVAAVLLLPVSGKSFGTIAGNECTIETQVTGNIAGVVEPTGTTQKTSKITFGVTSGKQNIQGVDLSTGGSVTATLNAFSTEATESASYAVTFEQTTEVT